MMFSHPGKTHLPLWISPLEQHYSREFLLSLAPPYPGYLADFITRDPSGLLNLSESQRSMLDKWKRPGEIYGGNGMIYPKEIAVFDLAQDVITDCSVVASLCSAIVREERSFGKVFALHPQI